MPMTAYVTSTATSSRNPRPCSDDWNTCALPWNDAVIVAGMVCAAVLFTIVTASPSDTPGLRLNDTVTAGSCPAWFTDSGPTPLPIDATEASCTSGPGTPLGADRMYR